MLHSVRAICSDMNKNKAESSVCDFSGKMKLATTIFVVTFDMRKAKKSPAQGGARIIQNIRNIWDFFEFPRQHFYEMFGVPFPKSYLRKV